MKSFLRFKMSIMKKVFLVTATACCFLFQVGYAQQLPCSLPVYRQFDFWIGEWEAFGVKGKKAGDSKISLIMDSCVILEEWASVSPQQGLRYAGKSFNTYNNAAKQWQQTWTDNTGTTIFYSEGTFSNNRIIFKTQPFRFSKDTLAIRRLTFFNLGEDKVRQLGEISKDNEVTWATEYDLEYRRKKDPASAAADTLLGLMQTAYNNGNFERIADYYSASGKIIGKNEEVSGRQNIIAYWKGFASLGGTWKLTNLKAEQVGNLVWQKGVSEITDKNKRIHKVSFTLILVQENNEWKILQDAYW